MKLIFTLEKKRVEFTEHIMEEEGLANVTHRGYADVKRIEEMQQLTYESVWLYAGTKRRKW